MEKTPTVSKTFRLPKHSIKKMEELARLLKETQTDILARAIDRLYETRESVLNEDIEARRAQVKKD